MSNNTISSADPQAVEKLESKLASLEQRQAHMKQVNSYYRKHGTCKGCDGLDDASAAALDKAVENGYSWNKQPYPSYELTNNNANIRNVKQRIADLVQKKEVGFVGWDFEGGKAVANSELDRLQLFFDEKPDVNLRMELKSNAFKWAPSLGAWQRQLTDNAIYAAGRIETIKPLSGESVRAIQPKAPQKAEQAVR